MQAFPRGGRQVLTALEYREAKISAEDDVLFGRARRGMERANQKQKQKQKQQKGKSSAAMEPEGMDEEDPGSSSGTVGPSKRSKIHPLLPKDCQVGLVAVASVLRVAEFDATVLLPGGISALLHVSELSDAHSAHFLKHAKKDKVPELVRDLPLRLFQFSSLPRCPSTASFPPPADAMWGLLHP